MMNRKAIHHALLLIAATQLAACLASADESEADVDTREDAMNTNSLEGCHLSVDPPYRRELEGGIRLAALAHLWCPSARKSQILGEIKEDIAWHKDIIVGGKNEGRKLSKVRTKQERAFLILTDCESDGSEGNYFGKVFARSGNDLKDMADDSEPAKSVDWKYISLHDESNHRKINCPY